MGDHEVKQDGRLRELAAVLGARAKKAYSAGVAGAALAIGGISVAGFWSDGKVDTNKVAAAAGSVVVGFVAGFLAAFLPRNAVAASSEQVDRSDQVR
jgi:streptomycin 6-kinase